MKTHDIRSKYLDFMKSHGHKIVSSASLVPDNDPTTLFTGSGMQPMVPYLLGQPHAEGKRVADSQKCFRSQDIEEVGDNRHTTFFEMLGNWSFGDYFKEEQIEMMWSFLVDELKLNPEHLYFSCFKGNDTLGIPKDTFSAEKWQTLFKDKKGMNVLIGENPEVDGMRTGEHIFYFGEKKNWWSRAGVPSNMPVGEPGGPDTEMFYDFDPKNILNLHAHSAWKDEPCHVNCDCGRFMEIGNNVFMQYIKTEDGFKELPQQNVDFGGGLERMAAAVQNNPDVFMLDVFDGARLELEALSGKAYGSDEEITYAMRVVLDHIRAAVFLIGDGVVPGNKDQMYFVRRLIRRAVRFARNIGISSNFTQVIAKTFIASYKDQYDSLVLKEVEIFQEFEKEETKFRSTLEKGMREFEKIATADVSGTDAFNLLQSFGFPVELTEELAKERGLRVDRIAFEIEKKAHAENSRTASEGKFKGGLGGDSEMEVKYHTATHMLHQALREVLGDEVMQKGSNITEERLRFDFAYGAKMTDEEKKKVEDIINVRIKEGLPVIREEISYDEARARGAIGLFDDKYGEKVSIYKIGDGHTRGDTGLFSMEFCGGPHVTNTKELGHFTLVKEEAVSAGVRRIKATLA